jgi:hypothetical protein
MIHSVPRRILRFGYSLLANLITFFTLQQSMLSLRILKIHIQKILRWKLAANEGEFVFDHKLTMNIKMITNENFQ